MSALGGPGGQCWQDGKDPRNQWNPFVDPQDCTIGQLVFTVCIYGYALFEASNLISDGSELLLLIPHWAPIVGSVVLPVLGAVPDGMMVLVSGLGDKAQEQVTVGVGALAGSTVMLLTLPFFLAMLAGRVSRKEDGILTYKRPAHADEDWDKLSPPGNLALWRTGVAWNPALKDSARFMLFTLIGYLLIQVPSLRVDAMLKLTGTPKELHAAQAEESRVENSWALIGLLFCSLSFSYYLYQQWEDAQGSEGQVVDRIANAEVEALREGKLTLRGALAKFRESNWMTLKGQSDLQEALINKDALDEVRKMCKVLAPFFAHYDMNGDNQIDFEEFRMIFKDVRENLPKEAQRQMFDAADTDDSGFISFEEFVACFMSFAMEAPVEQLGQDAGSHRRKTRRDPEAYLDHLKYEDEADEEDEDSGEEEEDIPEDLADLEPEEQQRRIKMRAFSQMAAGTALVLIFSDPTVDVLSEIGRRSNISAFYVSFVLAPLASNATELVAAYNYAKKRTVKSMTTSLSSLLGAGIMNNTFCLAIFLALIYFEQLAWEFTAETSSIIVTEVAIGFMVYTRKTLPLGGGVFILVLYPLAMILVWVLENKCGID